jgi:hypothetical protein
VGFVALETLGLFGVLDEKTVEDYFVSLVTLV